MTQKKIKWVIAHDPEYLFIRSATFFKEQLESLLPGEFDVEILTINNFNEKYPSDKKVSKLDVFDLTENNDIQISQIYTNWIADRYSKNFAILDLPFYWRDYAHAEKFFESSIGEELLNTVETGSKRKIKSLAFTYSGGYKIIPSDRPIISVKDFSNLKVKRVLGTVAEDLFSALQADHFWYPVDDLARRIASGDVVEAVESTYTRFYSLGLNKYFSDILDINYGLQTTSILVNNDFWNDLTQSQQQAIKSASMACARLERQESIEDAEQVKQKCINDGVNIAHWDDNEIKNFKLVSDEILKKYEEYFDNDLFNRIKNL